MSAIRPAVRNASLNCREDVTTILAVDLAARYSAACLMRDDYLVISQFDSWRAVSEDDFVLRLASPWMAGVSYKTPDVMVIEDLPHGLSYTKTIKKVCRLQGRIAQAMYDTTDGDVSDILFVSPATWRAHYPAAKRGTGPEIVFPITEAFGYLPPADLLEQAKGNGGPSRARKVASDYCSAYLIARWAFDTQAEHGTLDVPGTSRYGTKEILKKDFDAESSNDDENR